LLAPSLASFFTRNGASMTFCSPVM
jgi:hypothetical protein